MDKPTIYIRINKNYYGYTSSGIESLEMKIKNNIMKWYRNGEVYTTDYIEGGWRPSNVYSENAISNYKSSDNLYLFARNDIDGQPLGMSSIKVYYFEFEADETYGMKLIPCYRKSDNVIGLYDTVNDKFYINNGTGNFVKGNDVE